MALVEIENVEVTAAQRQTILQVLAREPLEGRPGWARARAEVEPNGSVRLDFNRHRSLFVHRDGRLTRR